MSQNRETSCHTASVVIQSDFVDGVPQISLSPESEDEINSFLQWEPGGYGADAINANALAYDPATGAFAQGATEIQVCVTKAPLSGTDISVASVESTDPKQMRGPLA